MGSGSQLSCPIDVQYNHHVSVRLCVKDRFSILLLKPDHRVVMNAKSLGLEKMERRGCMTSYQGSESCIGRRELLGSLWWVPGVICLLPRTVTVFFLTIYYRLLQVLPCSVSGICEFLSKYLMFCYIHRI